MIGRQLFTIIKFPTQTEHKPAVKTSVGRSRVERGATYSSIAIFAIIDLDEHLVGTVGMLFFWPVVMNPVG